MSNQTRWQTPDLSVWPVFGKLFGLRNEIHGLLEGPFATLTGSAQFPGVWNPPIDLYEDKDNVIVKAELPGLKKEDIEVSLQDGVLSVSGERKSANQAETAETYRTERFVGRFERAITLPTAVKNDQSKAEYQDGVLTVTLPKAEEAKPRQIKVELN